MIRRMLVSRRFHAYFAALSACLTVAAMLALPGCGGSLEFDKSTAHTPESLVHEFMLRYKDLPDQATAKQKEQAAKRAEAQAKAPDIDPGSSKSSRKEAATKGQMLAKTQTLDNILDALDRRIGSIEGLSRKEAAAKAIELIGKEPTIRDEDRKVIIERLSK